MRNCDFPLSISQYAYTKIFFVDFVVLLLPRRLLLEYQIVAGGNNKIFGGNKMAFLGGNAQKQ
jgi:hypothetical protein